MNRTRALALPIAGMLLLSGGCKDAPKQHVAPQAEPSPPAAQPEEKASPTQEKMRQHFSKIRDIERAVVAGDLELVAALAKELAEFEATGVSGYVEEEQAVRLAASSLGTAASLPEAATLAADLAHLCGDCHSTMTAITAFEWSPPPDNVEDKRMLRHQWAMDRLWEGIVGPSDALWNQGAEVLEQPGFDANDVVSDPAIATEVQALADSVQSLGAKAVLTNEPAARAALYKDLLQTCAACHAKARAP